MGLRRPRLCLGHLLHLRCPPHLGKLHYMRHSVSHLQLLLLRRCLQLRLLRRRLQLVSRPCSQRCPPADLLLSSGLPTLAATPA